MNIIPERIDYESLGEWLSLNRIRWQDLAKTVGASRETISAYKTSGAPLRSEWILAAKRAYGWSWPMTCYLCLGAPQPPPETTEKPTVTDLMQRIDDSMQALREGDFAS